MDRDTARKLLDAVASGTVSAGEALDRLTVAPFTRREGDPPHADPGYRDLGFARVDTHRALRTGDPEVVFAAGKAPPRCWASWPHSVLPSRTAPRSSPGPTTGWQPR